jgi:hypothetical protein
LLTWCCPANASDSFSSTNSSPSHQLSIVSIGDSIASGEGIGYGDTYDSPPPPPGSQVCRHQWCSSDPWAYGASVLALNLQSGAPSHPTAQGQQAVANIVLKSIPSNPTR